MITQISQAPDVMGGAVMAHGYQWLGDSRHVIYKANFNNPGLLDLYSASVDGNRQKKLSGSATGHGNVEEFDTQ